MKKLVLIGSLVLVAIVIVAVITTLSLSIWTQQDSDAMHIHAKLDVNPSEKYQMFVPVSADMVTVIHTIVHVEQNPSDPDKPTETYEDVEETVVRESTLAQSSYHRLSGTFSVSQNKYSYTLSDPSDMENIYGFALVGWFGGIAADVCIIPDEATVTVNGVEITKPVVQVLVDKDYSNYSFNGTNSIIRYIEVGSNVMEIDAGAFFGMKYLDSLLIDSNDQNVQLVLRSRCFGGCVNLSTVTKNRQIVSLGDADVFQGSGYVK